MKLTDAEIDQRLHELLGNPHPAEAGIEFHQRLRLRLQLESAPARRSWAAGILALYAVLAVSASGAILALIPWNQELLGVPFLVALACLAGVFLVPALLLRQLSWLDFLVDNPVDARSPLD